MANDKGKSVVFISRDHLELAPYSTPTVLRFDFIPKIIRDLEVINKEELYVYIKAFTEHYKVPAGNLIITLSDEISFQTDLTGSNQNIEEVSRDFIEMVPFENVGYKIIHYDKTIKLVAFNRNLYEAIKQAFTDSGFNILAVLPMQSYERGKGVVSGLDYEIAKNIANNYESFKQDNLLSSQPSLFVKQNQENISKGERKNSRELILIIIFLILLAVLGIVIYVNQAPSKPPPPPVSANNNQSSLMTTITQPPIPSLNPALSERIQTVNKADISILIVGSTPNNTKADNLKNILSNLGYTKVDRQTDNSISTVKTVLVLSRNLTADWKQEISTELNRTFPNLSVSETDSSGYDAAVILGRDG